MWSVVNSLMSSLSTVMNKSIIFKNQKQMFISVADPIVRKAQNESVRGKVNRFGHALWQDFAKDLIFCKSSCQRSVI